MNSTLSTSKIIRSQTRSSSMPSRSYPLIPQFHEHLHTLKSSYYNDSTSSSSLPSISKKLQILENIYNCVDDLFLLPHTQHVFARECNEKWVQEILDEYLSLVDACSIAKDFIFQSKEYVFNFLSFLRRRRDSGDHLSELMSSRKIMNKKIQKLLRNIGTFENKSSVLALDKDQETVAIISMLKETESATLELIESLLFSVAGAKSHSRPTGWCLVSKLIHSRKVSCQDHRNTILGFGDLDDALCKIVSLKASKGESGMRINELQKQLRDIELIMQVVEEQLECLFKRLIRTRVSLLNMQSQL